MDIPTDVVGDGECGVNGNEEIFSADPQTVDCSGNLAGPFIQGPFTLATETRLLGDDSALYQVRLSEQGRLLQSQLTPYRATKPGCVPRRASPRSCLEATREAYSILEEDHRGYDNANAPSGVTCDEHFGEDTQL